MDCKNVRNDSAVWVGPFENEPTRPKIEGDASEGYWASFDENRMSWGDMVIFTEPLGPFRDEPDAGVVVKTHEGVYWLVFGEHVPEWADPFVGLACCFDGCSVIGFPALVVGEGYVRLRKLGQAGLDGVVAEKYRRREGICCSRTARKDGVDELSCRSVADPDILSRIEDIEARDGVKVYHVAEKIEASGTSLCCFFVDADYGQWAVQERELEEGRALAYRLDLFHPEKTELRHVGFRVANRCVSVEWTTPAAV